jgi:hypothetical protein
MSGVLRSRPAYTARRVVAALALAASVAGCSGTASPVGPGPAPYAGPVASPYAAPPVGYPAASAPYGSMCYAGPYVCRMQESAPLGSSCTCPGLGAPSYGQVRGG